MSGTELGAFLRSRREALTPEQLGLPRGPRRRAPGLRRAEVATLAGVSVEYLTRLEQGRDRKPSAEVVSALSSTLQLSPDAHIHLHRLAKGDSGSSCQMDQPPPRIVRATVLALLKRMDPTPAAVYNKVGDVLAYTDGFAQLAGPTGLLEEAVPNLSRFIYLHANARTTFPEWEHVADLQAAQLRTQAAFADARALSLVQELADDPEFSQRWQRQLTPPPRFGVQRWRHPDAGSLRLAFESLELPDGDGQSLVVYLPDDEATESALDHLVGLRPGGLHAVEADATFPRRPVA